MTPSPDSSGRQDNDADCVDDDNLGVQPQNKFPATQFFILFAKKVTFSQIIKQSVNVLMFND